jgi:predicted RNase H-like HicB family nuclease
MKVYRFAVHPEEEGYFFLECINDPHLFTQARSMDEALYMARDVVESMYEIKGVIIELVAPPDVVTPFERRRAAKVAGKSTTSVDRSSAGKASKKAIV